MKGNVRPTRSKTNRRKSTPEQRKQEFYQHKPTLEQLKRDADLRANTEQQVIHVIVTARGKFVVSMSDLMQNHLEESFESLYMAPPQNRSE